MIDGFMSIDTVVAQKVSDSIHHAMKMRAHASAP
jgi:hypothetical protein